VTFHAETLRHQDMLREKQEKNNRQLEEKHISNVESNLQPSCYRLKSMLELFYRLAPFSVSWPQCRKATNHGMPLQAEPGSPKMLVCRDELNSHTRNLGCYTKLMWIRAITSVSQVGSSDSLMLKSFPERPSGAKRRHHLSQRACKRVAFFKGSDVPSSCFVSIQLDAQKD